MHDEKYDTISHVFEDKKSARHRRHTGEGTIITTHKYSWHNRQQQQQQRCTFPNTGEFDETRGEQREQREQRETRERDEGESLNWGDGVKRRQNPKRTIILVRLYKSF